MGRNNWIRKAKDDRKVVLLFWDLRGMDGLVMKETSRQAQTGGDETEPDEKSAASEKFHKHSMRAVCYARVNGV